MATPRHWLRSMVRLKGGLFEGLRLLSQNLREISLSFPEGMGAVISVTVFPPSHMQSRACLPGIMVTYLSLP